MNSNEQDDFLKQVVAFQVDDLTTAELAKLESDLVNDPEKRSLFIETQRRSSAIAEEFRNQSLTASADLDAESTMVKSQATSVSPWRLAIWIGFAASLALIVGFGLRPRQGRNGITKNAPSTFAKITYSTDAVWRAGDLEDATDDAQMNTEVSYQLVSGLARLQMHGGGIVTLAAPASFRGLGPNEFELVSGKIAARLPTEESELTVRVGEMAVRDTGTAFGITAGTNGTVDLSVFEGSVAIERSDKTGAIREQRIGEGKSLLAGDESSDGESVPFNAAQYDDVWPLTIGIDDSSSIIEFTTPGPQQPLAELANNSKLLLIPEQLNKPIRQETILKVLRPGSSWPESLTGPLIIQPGTVVSSYLLIYIPEDVNDLPRRSITGSIAFQRPILGVLIQEGPLNESDQLLGCEEIDYSSLAWRRLEGTPTDDGQVPPDALNISADGKRLYFNWHVSTGHDCIRVLVDEGLES